MAVYPKVKTTHSGVPVPVWVVIAIIGIALFPIGLVICWGIYKRHTWAWHVSTGLFGLFLFACTFLLAGTHEESGRLALFAPIYFFASLAFVGIVWRSADSRKWLRWGIGLLVIAVLAGLSTLLGRSLTFSRIESAIIGAAVITTAVGLVYLYSVAARRWCRARLGWKGPVLD